MKFYYPKDMNGNVIGFKTPESQVYDKNNKSLTDKLAEISSGLTITGIQGYEPETTGKKGLVAISSDYGTTNLGNSIEFHTKDNQTFQSKLYVGQYGELRYNDQYNSDYTSFRYKNFNAQEISINSLVASGIYRCSSFTDYPPECSDGQGTVIVFSYTYENSPVNTQVMGTDQMWLAQYFISAHNSVTWRRSINTTTISKWECVEINKLDEVAKWNFIFKDGSNQYLDPVDDLNTFYTGIGLFSSGTLNLPASDWHLVISAGVAGTITQVAYNLFNSTRPMQRHCAAGEWRGWAEVKVNAIPRPGGYFGPTLNGQIYADPDCVALTAHNTSGDGSNSNGLLVRSTNVPSISDAIALRTIRSGTSITDYSILHDGNSSRVQITNDGSITPANGNTLWVY